MMKMVLCYRHFHFADDLLLILKKNDEDDDHDGGEMNLTSSCPGVDVDVSLMMNADCNNQCRHLFCVDGYYCNDFFDFWYHHYCRGTVVDLTTSMVE